MLNLSHYFDVIDTEEKAYWLGFIMADGCNNENRILRVTLNNRDRKHLEKLRKSLKSNAPIKMERGNMCTLTVSSKILMQGLSKHGVIPNKTFATRMPDIPKHLVRHFIRGIFDGDGCITLSKDLKRAAVDIAGTKELLEQIQAVLIEELCLTKTKIIQTKSIFVLRYGGVNQPKKIGEWLYKNATIWLDRKHDKFSILCAGRV